MPYTGTMCGRFVQYRPMAEVASYLGVKQDHILAADRPPRYNIAPSADILAVRTDPEGCRELVCVRWGLVPAWAPEPRTGYAMINARAETVDTRPAFAPAFRRRRCLIPADGWYEWQRVGARARQPWYFHPHHDRPIAFAGLWEHWERGAQTLDTGLVIVCAANALAAPIHDRMPVIVEARDFALWLDPATPRAAAKALLRPAAPESLYAYPVSRLVNSATHEGPALIRRKEP